MTTYRLWENGACIGTTEDFSIAWDQHIKAANKSLEFAMKYQNSQRAFDKAINPHVYNHMIGPNGHELMVEKHQIPEEWTR